jgi:hypothetical protein
VQPLTPQQQAGKTDALDLCILSPVGGRAQRQGRHPFSAPQACLIFDQRGEHELSQRTATAHPVAAKPSCSCYGFCGTLSLEVKKEIRDDSTTYHTICHSSSPHTVADRNSCRNGGGCLHCVPPWGPPREGFGKTSLGGLTSEFPGSHNICTRRSRAPAVAKKPLAESRGLFLSPRQW